MFQSLSERLTSTIKNLTGRGRLTPENIKDSLREVRTALLEADVALPVVKEFIEAVESRAVGQEILTSLRPGEMLIKVVNDELIKILGTGSEGLNLRTTPPAIILIVGLQGSGKTTTTAKLANWLKKNQNKSILLTSTDIYRPAAMEQLETLASQIDISYFKPQTDYANQPAEIAKAAISQAKLNFTDVVIIDTAGRLHIDQDMMSELVNIHQVTNPVETLLVVDSMTGQDAVNIAKNFANAIPLTGIILTKTDGDARGGAALSMRLITSKPIKFIGTGEKIDALEQFYPERIASRILGMGDILSLVEDVESKIDHEKAQKLAKKIQKGKLFDLEDFREQLQQLRKMGGIASMLNKLPGVNLEEAQKKIDEKMFVRMEAIINSMTTKERHFPANIKGSHKRRIAQGSGTEVQDVNKLMRQFEQMQRMMKKMKGGKIAQLMGAMGKG